MLNYSKVVLDAIEREKAGTDYFCSEDDKIILRELLNVINEYTGINFQYLAELAMFDIHGTGEIIARYISKFSSESVRGYLIHLLVFDRIRDCDKLVLQLYWHFKLSDEYISRPSNPAPTHIYARYDNALKLLKPKRLKDDLIKLAHNPRDVFYLPLTMKMLASWKVPELKDLLIQYSSATSITAADVNISGSDGPYFPPLEYIKRELRFIAIDGLKHYPSDETKELIALYTNDPDMDVRTVAQRTIRYLQKHN